MITQSQSHESVQVHSFAQGFRLWLLNSVDSFQGIFVGNPGFYLQNQGFHPDILLSNLGEADAKICMASVLQSHPPKIK